MSTILIEPYVIRLKEKFRRKNKHQFVLNSFGDAGLDLFDVFKNYLAPYVNQAHQFGGAKAAKITAYQNNSRVLKGRLNVGEFGYSSQIVDVNTGNQNYLKLRTDADLTPYYFAIHLPANKTAGIVILQRIGKGGIRNVLDHLIESEFRATYEDTTLMISPLAPEEALKDALKNEIREVSFVQHSIPADLTDKFIPKKQTRGKFIVTVKTEEHAMPKINAWLKKKINGKSQFSDIIELESFQPDSIKATVRVGEKDRIMEISDKIRFKPSFDITEDVQTGTDGYAKFSSIDVISDSIAADLLKVVS